MMEGFLTAQVAPDNDQITGRGYDLTHPFNAPRIRDLVNLTERLPLQASPTT